MKKISQLILKVLFVLFVAFILIVSVRGLPGNPTPAQLNTAYWKDNGPFELSPERGRYALLYSLVEDHSFHLSSDIARFTSPDVGFINNNYVSIFAPSISLLAVPGYLIGKYFLLAQLGSFLWMAIFALLNLLLIRAIAIRLGANSLVATVAGLTFLFATPAFAYAVTLYEHHVSTFLLLLSFYLLIRFDNLLSLFIIWILYAFAFTVDYPNLFLMFPIALAAFFKSGAIERIQGKIKLEISFPRLFTILGVIFPLLFFLWINQISYGNPFKISGTVDRVYSVNLNGTPILWDQFYKKQVANTNQNAGLPPQGSIFTFFLPRNMMNGLYILLVSPDRGLLMFTPVMLFSIAGIYFAYKKKQKYLPILTGVIGVDIILYSMWGDPYGGWAFGARYLIPAYAILSIYVALWLTYIRKRRILLFLFFIVFSYSAIVNTLGAVTSNSNPPKVEADALSNITHTRVSYTYMRNVNDLNENISKSFVYENYLSNYISAWEYYYYTALSILLVSGFIILKFDIDTGKKYQKGENHAS